MEFIGIRDFRSKSAEIWKKLGRQKEIVITSSGKPVALLSSVQGVDLEESLRLLRQVRAMVALRKIQKNSLAHSLEKTSLEEINAVITDVRKKRSDLQ